MKLASIALRVSQTERVSRRIEVKKIWFSNLAMLLGCLSATTASGQYPGAYGSLAPSAFPVQQMQSQANFQSFPQIPQSQQGQWNQPQAYQAGVVAQKPAMPAQAYGSPSQSYSSSNQFVGAAPTQSFAQIAGQPNAMVQQNNSVQPGFVAPQTGMTQPGWFGQRTAPFQLVGAQEGVHAVPMQSAPTNIIPQVATPTPVPMQAPMQGAPQSIMEGAPIQQHSMGAVEHNHSQALSYQSSPNAPIMNPVYGQSIAPGCTSCGSAPVSESYGYPVYSQDACGPTAYASPFSGRMSNYARSSFFTGMPAGSKPFFGGGSVLLFHRIDDDNVNLVYDVNMPDRNVLGTQDARSGLMPGFEVFLGRYFNCGRNAITASYWGLYPDDEMATITTAGGRDLRSRYQFTGVTMPAFGTYDQAPVYDWYDTADPAAANNASQAQRIDRSSEYHNIEANLLGFMTGGAARSFYLPNTGTLFSGTRGARRSFGGGFGGGCGYCGGSGCGMCGSSQGGSCGTGSCGSDSCGGSCGTQSCGGDCYSGRPTRYATGPCCLTPGCGSRLNMTWLAGVRYFRFEDNLTYASSVTDTTFGDGNDDIYYTSNVVNDLVGFQIGGTLNYCTGRRASLYATTKTGIYGNHARFDSDLGTRNGHRAYLTGSPADEYIISASKTDVAFISELGSGVNYRLTSKWSGNVGYRAIIASGVATSVDQLPINMSHLGNAADFDNNAALILHGVNLGAQYNY